MALALSCLAFVVYFLTLAPGLLESDSAEFQTLAATPGYAHPTGYPVYLLAAHAATRLPVGDVAYRVNLWSAICAGAAVGLAYLFARELTGRRWPAIAAAVALAVSPTFWSQAIIAKVYPMGIALMVAIVLCLVRWRRGRQCRWLAVAACLGGISIGVHSTHSLMAPAALLLVAMSPEGWRRKWPAAIGGALLGVAVTLTAYWIIDRADSHTSYFRTVIGPSQSLWGLDESRMQSFPDRVALCLRPPQYMGLFGRQPPMKVLVKFQWYVSNLPCEFPWPWLLLSLLGIGGLARRDGLLALFLLLTFVSHLVFDMAYDMGGIHVLYLATYVPIVLFGAVGLDLAATWLAGVCSVRASCGVAPPVVARPVPAAAWPHLLAGLVGLAIVLWPLAWRTNWSVEGRRECRVPPGEDPFRVLFAPTPREPMDAYHQRVRELVDDLEPGAVLFTGWCLLYPNYYVAHIEKGRTDLVFVQDYPQADHFELADSAMKYAEAMASAGRAVYFTHRVRKVEAKYELQEVRRGRDTLYRLGAKKLNSPDRPSWAGAGLFPPLGSLQAVLTAGT